MLRPDNQDGTYYDEFDLVPSQLRPLLNAGKVLVTNWHTVAPESAHSGGGRSYVVANKGEESSEAFARRVLGDLYDRAKYQAAQRWVAAVNHWSQLGSWAFHVCHNPQYWVGNWNGGIVEIQFDPQTLAPAAERGANEEKIREVINAGFS